MAKQQFLRWFYGICIGVLFVGIVLPVVLREMGRGCVITYDMVCRNNFRNVGTALNYHYEHDGQYPKDLYELWERRSAALMQLLCPSDRDRVKVPTEVMEWRAEYDHYMKHSSYVYLGNGLKKGEDRKVLMYERPHDHSGGRVVGMHILFTDGFVKFYEKGEGLKVLKLHGIDLKTNDKN